jgi:trehalose 6-phosphate synthase
MASTINYRVLEAPGKVDRAALAIDQWHPIVASNRGPVEYTLAKDGELVAKRGSGGVVTALGGLSNHLSYTWIAGAASEGDQLAAEHPLDDPAANPRLGFVVLSPEVYDHYYNLFSNPLLWFLQHSLMHRLEPKTIEQALSTGWAAGYVPANFAFAHRIAAEARRLGKRPVVLLQDYHLYLAAGYLRRMLPDALLQHFTHIPWPAPAAWLALPVEMRRMILRSMLANDIVGFQTARDAQHFLQCCATFLPQVMVDHSGSRVIYAGHQTWVRDYPISIDIAELRSMVDSPKVAEFQERLRPLMGERTIVRVDRLDPSKDVPSGFRAFERLLEEHPEWHGRVKFLAFLVPSRTAIPEYRRYAEETFALAATINDRYGQDGYQPVHVIHENNHPQAMAGLTLYDVLLVNPLADGMNLVAKEGPVANQRDGVLVLSEGAGAHEQLRPGALSVRPGDIAGMAAALAEALTMPLEERRRRGDLLRKLVAQADLANWLRSQLDDLARFGMSMERSIGTGSPASHPIWIRSA